MARRPLFALVFACALLCARASLAQCGASPSQCHACHVVRGDGPSCDAKEPWHRDHGFAGLCAECHGGDREAVDIGMAHAAMKWPLVNEGARCEACHQGKGTAMAAAYAAFRKANPRTSFALAPRPAEGAVRRRAGAGDLALAAAAVLLGAGGVAFVVSNERRLRGRDR